jgi:hypothetical protein
MHQHIAIYPFFTKIFKIFPLAFKPKDFRAHSFRPTTRLRAQWFEPILQYRNLNQKDTLTRNINLVAIFLSSMYQVFQIIFQIDSLTQHSNFSSPSYMSHPSHSLWFHYCSYVSCTFQVRSNTLCNFLHSSDKIVSRVLPVLITRYLFIRSWESLSEVKCKLSPFNSMVVRTAKK